LGLSPRVGSVHPDPVVTSMSKLQDCSMPPPHEIRRQKSPTRTSASPGRSLSPPMHGMFSLDRRRHSSVGRTASRETRTAVNSSDAWCSDVEDSRCNTTSENMGKLPTNCSDSTSTTAASRAEYVDTSGRSWTEDTRTSPSPRLHTPQRTPTGTPRFKHPIERNDMSTASSSRIPLRQSPRNIEAGTPCTFYLEGNLKQQFGRVRSVASNGTYTVDLVGGGRMCGLEAVTRCGHADLLKVEASKAGITTSPDKYAEYQTRNASASCLRSNSSPHLGADQEHLPSGCPVSFYTEESRLKCYGRIRCAGNDGYTVDLAAGGCKTGVQKVTKCSPDELAKMSRRGFFRVSKDAWEEYATRNAELQDSDSMIENLEVGSPVKFRSQKTLRLQYGRIRSSSTDGKRKTYMVDVVGGGFRVGMDMLQKCSEEDLANELIRDTRRKNGLKLSKDAWGEYSTRNALIDFDSDASIISHASQLGSPHIRGVAVTRIPHHRCCGRG